MIVNIFDTAVVLYFIEIESTAYITRGYCAEKIYFALQCGVETIQYNKARTRHFEFPYKANEI